jgi:polysaccharide pyruvyl transferase WcaK-like protein
VGIRLGVSSILAPASSMSIRVLVTNWESADNLGDYAILRAQVTLLEEHLGARVSILGNQPGVTLPEELADKHCGDSPWPNPLRGGLGGWGRGLLSSLLVLTWPSLGGLAFARYRSLLRLLAETDVVMPKGGGYLMAEASLRSFFFLLRTIYPLLLSRRLGVPRALWGHSIGPVRGWPGRALLRTALTGARIVVRDDASCSVCNELGLRVGRGPDLALLTLPPEPQSVCPQFSKICRIGVTVRRVTRSEESQHQFLKAVSKAVTLMAANAAHSGQSPEIHLIPQVTGPTSIEDDRPALASLAALLPQVCCVVDSQPQDVLAALDMYEGLDFLLATRMHSAILAACAGTPFAVFGYVGGKAQGMVQDLALPEWTTTSQVDQIPVTAMRCFRSRDQLRSRIAVGLQAARSRISALSLSDLVEDKRLQPFTNATRSFGRKQKT